MGGISTNTPNYMLYGTNGYLTVGGTDIGATIGDIVIEWGADQYYPELHQAMGPVAGTGKVTGGFFRIRCTIAEWDYNNLSAVMGTIGADSSGSSEKFGGTTLENVAEVDNVIVTGVERNDGKDFRATIPKAYVEVGNITLTKTGETGLELTFHGLYTTSAPTTLPGYIEIEK